VRASVNLENEKIGYKIRNATVMKVPYLVIIGDKEVTDETVTVRKRSGENIGPFTAHDFIGIIREKIDSKSLET
jgi:threonyl-tRNA synthetase